MIVASQTWQSRRKHAVASQIWQEGAIIELDWGAWHVELASVWNASEPALIWQCAPPNIVTIT